MQHKMGIDLGGTKTEVLILDHDQQPIFRERLATRAHSYEEILDMITDLVLKTEVELGLNMSVGIGIPGGISPETGLLRNSNTVCLNGRPFLSDIETRLKREIRIENDANCFALSEALGGAGQGYGVVFGVIIGTGTGGGILVDGRLLNGPLRISGEWGHNPLPWLQSEDGMPPCYCGKSACIETFLSGPGFEHNYRVRFGDSLSSREIIARAIAADADCCAMLETYHDQLARALAHLINILDPDAIVLGGGMSNIDSIYLEVPRRLPAYVFSDFCKTPILKATRGDASGVYGAAMLWE